MIAVGDDRFKQSGVLSGMDEGGESPPADGDVIVGGEGYSDGVVKVEQLLVWVCSGDVKVDGGGKVGGGGCEFERRDFEGGDGEGGTVRTVEEINDGAGNGEEEDKKEDKEGEPEAAGAATASGVRTTAMVGLRTVGRACGAVKLSLCSWERRVWVGGGGGGGGGGVGGGAIGVGLS